MATSRTKSCGPRNCWEITEYTFWMKLYSMALWWPWRALSTVILIASERFVIASCSSDRKKGIQLPLWILLFYSPMWNFFEFSLIQTSYMYIQMLSYWTPCRSDYMIRMQTSYIYTWMLSSCWSDYIIRMHNQFTHVSTGYIIGQGCMFWAF